MDVFCERDGTGENSEEDIEQCKKGCAEYFGTQLEGVQGVGQVDCYGCGRQMIKN